MMLRYLAFVAQRAVGVVEDDADATTIASDGSDVSALTDLVDDESPPLGESCTIYEDPTSGRRWRFFHHSHEWYWIHDSVEDL